MLLSIIIPHYNSSEALWKLLRSVPRDESIQIIVVDDKSNPHELNAIKRFQDSVCFELYENFDVKSAGTCRNIGLKKAAGDWVLFADADDYFSHDFYRVVSAFFESKNDVVYFIPVSIYADSGKEANRHLSIKNILETYIKTPNIKNEILVKYKIVVPWSKLYRRDFLIANNLQFDEVIASNDVMFSIKAASKIVNFQVCTDVIYTVTRGEGSLTVKLSEEVFWARVKVFADMSNYLNSILSRKEYSLLGYSGLSHVLSVFLIYGFGYAVKAFFYLRQKNIKFFYVEHFSPKFLLKQLSSMVNRLICDKKYMR